MTIINEDDFPLLPSQSKTQQLDVKRRTAIRGSASNGRKRRTSFNDLPDELILEILEHLLGTDVDSFQFSTLPKLALTSRRLYRLVIGRLYQRYDNRVCEPYLFLRTLISNPSIAEQVRDVHISFSPQVDDDDYEREWLLPNAKHDREQYIPTAKDKRVIKEGLRVIDIPSWKTRASECNEGSGDGRVLDNTILLYTPNVASINHEDSVRVPSPKPEWVHIISKASVGAFGGIHHFEHLISIKIDVLGSYLSNFAPLFRVQSLRKMHLLAVAEHDFTTGTAGIINNVDKHARELQRLILPACNNLEELNLEKCFYSELCLDVMVKSSRRLKTFKYSADLQDEWDWEYEWKWYELPRDRPKTIVRILRHHEASLETLHIFGDYQVDRSASDRIHLYDNMTAFTSLKEINCPLGMITSGQDHGFADRLPSSLVKLRMPWREFTPDHERFDDLKHMLVNCRTYTPQLQEVRVVQSPYALNDWQEFIELSSEVGVRFACELEPIDPDPDDSEDSDDSDDISFGIRRRKGKQPRV